MIKHSADDRTLDLTRTTNDWTNCDFGFPNGNTYSTIDPNKKRVALFSELSRCASQSKGNEKQKQLNGNMAINLQHVHEDDHMTDCPRQLFERWASALRRQVTNILSYPFIL